MTQRKLTMRHADATPAPATARPASGFGTPPGVGSGFTPAGLGSEARTAVSQARLATAAATKKKVKRNIITAEVLIPGDGDPVGDGALVTEDKLIVWVGTITTIPQHYYDEPHQFHAVPCLMPGLWDCHVHFGGEAEADDRVRAILAPYPVTCGARLTMGCWEALQRGYTSLRDVAGFGCEMARAVDEGSIVGPNIYSSGAALSQLAGHGDCFALPAGDVMLNLGVESIKAGHQGNAMTCIVDGVDECRRGVRLQVRRGAKCIKVMASGGVMSEEDNPMYVQFSPEELEAIVKEAARMHRTVAAHVHGKEGIVQAVKAGVTSVEHISFADQECVDLIKDKGTIVVVTRTVIELLLETGGVGLPALVWEKAKLVGSHHLESYKLAVDAGVTFALGTDTAPGFNMAMELDYAVQAGLTPLEAIKAATANGPLTVGDQAPKTGQLKVGYEADMLGVWLDPVQDVKVLQDKDNIPWVWKGGRLFKGPGIGPWGEDV